MEEERNPLVERVTRQNHPGDERKLGRRVHGSREEEEE